MMFQNKYHKYWESFTMQHNSVFQGLVTSNKIL